jgi:drug/metabolite transporter (DMT)-like permease
MIRLIIILLIALILEALGVVFLSKGLKEIAAVLPPSPSPIALITRAAVHPMVLIGVAFEAGFFAGLLYLLSQQDVSVVWPLTALGFVVTTLAAKFILREEISITRWIGITLIVIGAALVCYTESIKSPAPSQNTRASTANHQ